MTEQKEIKLFDLLPSEKELSAADTKKIQTVKNVNSHIHTPYSFSAFDDIKQAVTLASNEGVKVLGINDFFITDGYAEFEKQCIDAGVFPMFNIEFTGLLKEYQKRNIRVNDPNNPGRIYLCGKGLKNSNRTKIKTGLFLAESLSEENKKKLNLSLEASSRQITEMIYKLNELLKNINGKLLISLDEIKSRFAKRLIRERHIAKAVRVKSEEIFPNEKERSGFYINLFGESPTSSLDNHAALENEIRSRLLKAGGKAFVPEDETAFMNLEDIKNIILDAGGIPVYPVLLDDSKGNYTEFESKKENLLEELKSWGINFVEFIPGRNDINSLKDYIRFFYEKGFVITFGTEHNTPQLIPLKVSCRNGVPLDDYLKEINYKGACVITAHQYYHAKMKPGYVENDSLLDSSRRNKFEKTGASVLEYYFKS